MGSLDFLLPTDLPYPAASSTSPQPQAPASVPYLPAEATGFLNNFFNPKQLAYPMPAVPPKSASGTQPDPPAQQGAAQAGGGSASSQAGGAAASAGGSAPQQAQSGSASAPIGQSGPPSTAGGQGPGGVVLPAQPQGSSATLSPSAPAPSPVTVVIAPWPAAAGGLPAVGCPPPSAPASGDAPAPVGQPPAQPSAPQSQPAAPPPKPPCTIVTAESLSPKFRAHHVRAQEVYLEEVLDEKMTAKMISRDASPLAFVVPDGCDSVEFSYGPIELNPGVGKAHDLDQVVTVGEATISADAGVEERGPLTAGSAVVVTVPWRAASWVDLPAGRLRVTVFARFFAAPVEEETSAS